MKLVSLALICFILSSCAPKAWSKSGFSLEQGDAVLRACETTASASTPTVSFFDVDVDVFIRNSYYNDFSLQSSLENRLQNEAQDILNEHRRDIITEKTRACMRQDGWQEVDDPR